MACKDVLKAAKVLRSDGSIKSLSRFWDLFGRPDLAYVYSPAKLVGAPTLQSVLYFAAREIDARIALDEPENKKAKKRPLTAFVVPHDGAKDALYYHLRATKGWRRERIDRADEKAYAKQGVPICEDVPATRAFDRWRVAA